MVTAMYLINKVIRNISWKRWWFRPGNRDQLTWGGGRRCDAQTWWTM